MNICPNCGNPISRIGTGALQPSSNHCPKCNALISSVSTTTSQRSTSESHLYIKSLSKTSMPSYVVSNSGTGPISTGQLTEEVNPSTKFDLRTGNTESEAQMNTESETPQPVLSEDNPLLTSEEREEARRLSLSRQGFVLEEDARGLRLSGVTSRPRGLSSQLSPYDVVRLAAELEGGVVPMDQRKRCPKCEAVVCPGDKQCQWCSEPLDT